MSILEAKAPTIYVTSDRFFAPAREEEQHIAWKPINKYEFEQHAVNYKPPVDLDLPLHTIIGNPLAAQPGDSIIMQIGTRLESFAPLMYTVEQSEKAWLMIAKTKGLKEVIKVKAGSSIRLVYKSQTYKGDLTAIVPYGLLDDGYYGITTADRTHLYIRLATTEESDVYLVKKCVICFGIADAGFTYQVRSICTPMVSHLDLAAILNGDDQQMPVDANPFKSIKRTFTRSRASMVAQYTKYKQRYEDRTRVLTDSIASAAIQDFIKPIPKQTFKGGHARKMNRKGRSLYRQMRTKYNQFSRTAREYVAWMKKLKKKLQANLKSKKAKAQATRDEDQQLLQQIQTDIPAVQGESAKLKAEFARVMGQMKANISTWQILSTREGKIRPGAASMKETSEVGEEEPPESATTTTTKRRKAPPPPKPKAKPTPESEIYMDFGKETGDSSGSE